MQTALEDEYRGSAKNRKSPGFEFIRHKVKELTSVGLEIRMEYLSRCKRQAQRGLERITPRNYITIPEASKFDQIVKKQKWPISW